MKVFLSGSGILLCILFCKSAEATTFYVNASNSAPVSPFHTWAAAATNIQDAIDVAAAGDTIMVTNGIYVFGGKVISGTSNRVALDKPVTVMSVNGYTKTFIQGAWDPIYTNGPASVRCAYLTNGATLSGFTLQNGATPAGSIDGDISDSGGGAFCAGTNAIVSNCLLTNDISVFGGGICHGTLNNSLAAGNFASFGGGAYSATLNNCTVVANITFASSSGTNNGSGTFFCTVRNSIVLNNLIAVPGSANVFIAGYNYFYTTWPNSDNYSNSVTHPLIFPVGASNIDVNPQFLDLFHIPTTSPCLGAGNAAYAVGTDLDGESWLNPPSIGCDEVILTNLVGPLSVSLTAYQTNWITQKSDSFWGSIVGRVSRVQWSFGDGTILTNIGINSTYAWTNPGNYTVTLTAYNTDNPSGISTNTAVHVDPFPIPQLKFPLWNTNGFQFQFTGVTNPYYPVTYIIQYSTNLTSPSDWKTLGFLGYLYSGSNSQIQINDSSTNAVRFYRIIAQ